MTSLDDTIISKQNLILLDNVTNYGRPAVDYFTQEFKAQDIAMTWRLLVKMRNHKLLRLPSCSPEDDKDYHLYLVRLHHVLWRRWSQLVVATGERVDPLSLNWDKDLDVTVLYGPDLAHKMLRRAMSRGRSIRRRCGRLTPTALLSSTEVPRICGSARLCCEGTSTPRDYATSHTC